MSVNLDAAVYVYLLDFSEKGGGQFVGVAKDVKNAVKQYINGWSGSKISEEVSQAVRDFGQPKLSILHSCKYKFEALQLKKQEMEERGLTRPRYTPTYKLTDADRRKPRKVLKNSSYVVYLLKWNEGNYVGTVRRKYFGKIGSFNFTIELLQEIMRDYGKPEIEILHSCESYKVASELQKAEIKRLGTLLPNGFNPKGKWCIYLDYYAMFNEHFMEEYEEQWEIQPYQLKKAAIEKEMIKRGWGFAIRLQQKSLDRK